MVITKMSGKNITLKANKTGDCDNDRIFEAFIEPNGEA